MEHVLSWDENKVSKWMSSIGYSCFEKQFKEQGITGDVLVNLDHESLRDLSVLTVGQRMDLLKNIYQLKIHYKVPVNEWDYIPPSVLYETDWLGQNGMADYRKIEAAFQERDARIKRLTEDLQRINNDLSFLKDEVSQLTKYKDKKNDSNNKLQSKVAYSYKLAHSPTSTYHNISNNNNNNLNSVSSLNINSTSRNDMLDESKNTPNVMMNDGGAIKVYGDKISKVELEPESSKNVRLLLDDPTSKVIMSALKKYNVVSEWQQYALWIQYGPHDNMQERALGYDEKPLKISQKLKEAKQNPVFVLKHVKDNKPFNPANYTNPRPAPKPLDKAKHNITSGKVGFEVVIPVMSSSVSSPTSSPQPPLQLNSSSSSTVTSKRNQSQPQSQPQQPQQQPQSQQQSQSQSQSQSNQSQSQPQPQPQPTIYNNELGLDNAVVNAIFSINNSPPNS